MLVVAESIYRIQILMPNNEGQKNRKLDSINTEFIN